MFGTQKQKLIEAIQRAQGQWTCADWAHERTRNGKVCFEPDPYDPREAVPEQCPGDNDQHCDVCQGARADARTAQGLGNEAIKAIQADDFSTALERLQEASSLEDTWGDSPVWGPVVEAIEDIA